MNIDRLGRYTSIITIVFFGEKVIILLLKWRGGGGRGLSYYNPRQKCKQFRRYFSFVFDPNPLYIFSFTFIINKQIIPVDAYARLSAECSIEGPERSIIKVVWCQREIRLGIFYDYLVSYRTACTQETQYGTQ